MYLLIDNYQVLWKRLISLWNQESLVPRISFHGHQSKGCKLIKLWKQPSVSMFLCCSWNPHTDLLSTFHLTWPLADHGKSLSCLNNFIETHEHPTGPHEAGDQDENLENCWNKKSSQSCWTTNNSLWKLWTNSKSWLYTSIKLFFFFLIKAVVQK